MTFLVFVWADPGLVLFGALFLVKFDGFFNEKYIYIYRKGSSYNEIAI